MTTDSRITDQRRLITEIDDQIARLAASRMKLVAEIAAYKKDAGIPLRDIPRETEILNRAAQKAGAEYADSVCAVFRTLLDEGRNRLFRS